MQRGDKPTSARPSVAEARASQSAEPSRHSAGLYVLPALIVLIFVGAWLFAFWLLHEGQDPRSLVQGMQQPGRRSWQKAYALSQLLSDPEHDELKDDVQLCRALADILTQQNQQAEEARQAGEPEDDERVRFRAFLCRALGTFRLPDGLPALLDCAATETSHLPARRERRQVRLAAIEAIAVLSVNVGTRQIQANPTAVDVLVAASREAGRAESTARESDVAAAATFALGVIGGPQATAQLVQLVADTRPDVRYNAATGLARQSRPEAIPVLLEMLDPENRMAVQDEKTKSARTRKQGMILRNAIRATERLVGVAAAEQQQALVAGLQHLRDSESVPARIRIDAKETLLKLCDE